MTRNTAIPSILFLSTLTVVLTASSHFATARDSIRNYFDTACIASGSCLVDTCPSKNIGASCVYCDGSYSSTTCFGSQEGNNCLQYIDDDGCGVRMYGVCQLVNGVKTCVSESAGYCVSGFCTGSADP